MATHMGAYVRHATRVIGTKTTIYKYPRVAIYIDWAVTRRELPELSVCSALPSPQHEPKMHTDTRIYKPDRFQ